MPTQKFQVANLYRTAVLRTPFECVDSAASLRQAISEAYPYRAPYELDASIKEMLGYYSDVERHEQRLVSTSKSHTQKRFILSIDQAMAIKETFEKFKEELGWGDLDSRGEPRVGTKDQVYTIYRELLTLLATVACSEIQAKEKLQALTTWSDALKGRGDSARSSRLIMEEYRFDCDHFVQNLRYIIAVQALREAKSESKFFALYKALDDLYTRLFAKGFRLQWPIGMAKANKLFSASVDFFMQALEAEDAVKAATLIKDYKAKMAATTWHPALRAVLAMSIVGALAFGLMVALQVAMGIAPMVVISFALLSVASVAPGAILALFTIAAPGALALSVLFMKSHSYYPTQKITHLITVAEKIHSTKAVKSGGVVARTDSQRSVRSTEKPGGPIAVTLSPGQGDDVRFQDNPLRKKPVRRASASELGSPHSVASSEQSPARSSVAASVMRRHSSNRGQTAAGIGGIFFAAAATPAAIRGNRKPRTPLHPGVVSSDDAVLESRPASRP